MPINVETLAVDQLENLVENHRRKHATGAPLYADALRELGARNGKGLEFDKFLSIISGCGGRAVLKLQATCGRERR
jgi:hypothetical protein